MSSNRVAFILYSYPLGVSSMIISSIKMFVQKGFHVDVYINERTLNASPIKFTEDKVSIIAYDDETGIWNFILKGYEFLLMKIPKFQSLFVSSSNNSSFNFCLYFFYPRLFVFSEWLKKRLSIYDYDYIMPVECRSLLCLYHLIEKEKIVYYNMELLDWSEDNPLYTNQIYLKNLEYRIIETISHVAIQSLYRAKSFSKINNFDMNNIYILPVASMGEPVTERSRFFRDLFDIPRDHKVVVYAGNFNPWAQCLEIIHSVEQWPKGYSLVMHTWNKSIVGTSYYREMQNEARGLPVYFSTEYIEYEELPVALSSADVGLMFYESIDTNFTEILFSSNKLSEYLKAGLPVICSDFPSLKEFVEENAIGVAISAINDIPKALEFINGQVELFRKSVFACYQKKFRFENYFEDFYCNLPK